MSWRGATRLRLAMRITTGMNIATTPVELMTEPRRPVVSIRILNWRHG